MQKHLVIAIDGPAGAGKSTAAKQLAKKLHIHMLDTGALFRAFALHVLEAGIAFNDTEAINRVLSNVKLDIQIEEGGQRTLLNGEDVSDKIRTPQIGQGASSLGANAYVRKVLTDQVRKIAKTRSLVVDGRDIGTAMLPDATIKFFLTASPHQRAQRRHKEQKQLGICLPYDDVLKEILSRDEADANRPIAPLSCAEDAIVIDSTDLDVHQVLEIMLQAIEERTR